VYSYVLLLTGQVKVVQGGRERAAVRLGAHVGCKLDLVYAARLPGQIIVTGPVPGYVTHIR
jgi:hypothetical protein